MEPENPIIQGLINAMLVIIPSGGILRIILCAVAMMNDDEKHGENKRRVKNVIGFIVFAELVIVIINLVYQYYG